MNKNIKQLSEAQVDSDDRTATFVISSEIMDYDNEVILVDGVDISAIKKGARDIAWLNHDYHLPSAKITGIEKIGKKIYASVMFPTNDSGVELKETFPPDKAYAFAKAGLLKASIDFLPVEQRIPTKKDKATFGTDVNLVHSKTRLVGFSLVSLPSNEEAEMLTIKALKENKISSEDLKMIDGVHIDIEEIIPEEVIEEVIEPVIEPVEEPAKVEFDAVELDEPEPDKKELAVAKAMEILESISHKKTKKAYYTCVETNPEIVRKQIAKEIALRFAKKTGQIFID